MNTTYVIIFALLDSYAVRFSGALVALGYEVKPGSKHDVVVYQSEDNLGCVISLAVSENTLSAQDSHEEIMSTVRDIIDEQGIKHFGLAFTSFNAGLMNWGHSNIPKKLAEKQKEKKKKPQDDTKSNVIPFGPRLLFNKPDEEK